MSEPENKQPEGGGRFKPGQSGNPGGRPKALLEVVELARSHTVTAIMTLARIAADEAAPAAAQVAASNSLLERGWGKAVQPITGEEGGPIITRIEYTWAGDTKPE